MKSIDVKSLLIGFLLCATFFLSVGARPASDGVGTFQMSSAYHVKKGWVVKGMINTKTGELYHYSWREKAWILITSTFKD